MKNTKRKSGISLIVLVITIIVMIILAGSIILSLSNSGIIDKANKAKNDTDVATLKEVAGVAAAEYELEVAKGSTTKTKKEYVEEYLTAQSLTLPEGYEVTEEGQVKSLLIWDGNVATSFASGTGTEADPYIIETAAEFAYLSVYTKENDTTSEYFKLMVDVDLNNIEYNVIGCQVDGNKFRGTFDGQNHKISNLNISENNSESSRGAGLFGYTESGSVIRNIVLESGKISGNFYRVGGICGYNSGRILRCSFGGSANGSYSFYGEICGENDGGIIE